MLDVGRKIRLFGILGNNFLNKIFFIDMLQHLLAAVYPGQFMITCINIRTAKHKDCKWGLLLIDGFSFELCSATLSSGIIISLTSIFPILIKGMDGCFPTASKMKSIQLHDLIITSLGFNF